MRKISEEKALQQLKINSFRELSKEKFMDFISVLQDLDPEVQMKALEQFPEFISTAKEALSGMKENALELLKSEDKGLECTSKSYEMAIDYLGGLLNKEGLSSEEKMEIAHMIFELAQKQGQNLAGHRAFEEGVQSRYLTGVLATMALGVAALGVKVVVPRVL